MTTATEFQSKVDKTSINMDRLDQMVNGGPDAVVAVDGGIQVPSFANLQKRGQIAVEGAESYRDQALDAAGVSQTYITYAQASSAASSLPAGALVQVLTDENRDGARTIYKIQNGAIVFQTKIAYVFGDLSNISPQSAPTFAKTVVGAPVPNSPYLGGIDSKLQVSGLVAFAKTTNGGEHRLINYWDGNNSVSIQNLSNNDSYSAVRFLDYQGREAMAVGYGNPGTVADLPFATAGYFETSPFINADGSPDNTIIPRPLRLVQTGYMMRRTGQRTQGVFGRVSFEPDGSFNYYHLDPRWSYARPLVTFTDAAGMYSATFFDHDDNQVKDARMTQVLRVRRKNYDPSHTYSRPGVVIGPTFEGDPANGGVPPPQVWLDVGGAAIFGDYVGGADRSYSPTSPNNNDFAITTVAAREEQVRLFRPFVGRIDFRIVSGGGRGTNLALIDTDNGSKVPLAVAINGSRNVYACGADNAGGGAGVLALLNATTEPSQVIANGVALYCVNGVLKFMGPNGVKTITTN